MADGGRRKSRLHRTADELGGRILSVLEMYPTREAAAAAAGLSTDMLANYVKGASRPNFRALSRLCREVGVSLDWLATGTGEILASDRELAPPAASLLEIDEDLHAHIMEALIDLYKPEYTRPKIPAAQIGRLAAQWHQLLTIAGDTFDERRIILKGLVEQHRMLLRRHGDGVSSNQQTA